MIAKFTVNEAGIEEDEYSIVTGVASAEPRHYLSFGRSLPIGSAEDWGVHIECDDQTNSGYDKIKQCVLTRDFLRVELSEPIGRLGKFSGFEISLVLSESSWNLYADNLRRVFEGKVGILHIDGVAQ